jgi:hypothetical protein
MIIMKKFAFILSMAVLAAASTSCKKIKGSNNITTEIRAVSTFTQLEVEDAFEVDITYSPTEELVEVEAPDNLHEFIVTDVVSGRLKVHFQHNKRIKTNHPVKIHITTADLNKFEISNASNVVLNNALNTYDFRLDMSGASNFEGEVNVSNVEIDMSGASNAKINGTATNAFVELSGASTIRKYEFEIGTLDIQLSGASTAFLTILNSMSVELSGASTLNYKGDPVITQINTSGASNINKN